ncbi:hypothetical protein D3C81_2290440 [compost metagenome]
MHRPVSGQLAVVKNPADTILADQFQQQLRLKNNIRAIEYVSVQQQGIAVFAADMRRANQVQCDIRRQRV